MKFQSVDQPTYCPTMSTKIPMRRLMTAIKALSKGPIRVHVPSARPDEVPPQTGSETTVPTPTPTPPTPDSAASHCRIIVVHALDKLFVDTASIYKWINDVKDRELTTREFIRTAMDYVTVMAEGEEGEDALEQKLHLGKVRVTAEVPHYFGMSTQKTTLTNDEWLRIIVYALSPDECTPARKLLEHMRAGQTLGIVDPVDKGHLENAQEEEIPREDIPEGVRPEEVAPAREALARLNKHQDGLINAIESVQRVFFSLSHDDDSSILMTDEGGTPLPDEQFAALKTRISQHLRRVQIEDKRRRNEKKRERVWQEESESEGSESDEEEDDDENYEPDEEEEEEEDDEEMWDEDDYEEENEGGKRKRAKGDTVDGQGKRRKYN